MLFLSFATLAASCSDDKNDPAPEPPVKSVSYSLDFTTLSKAVYFGDRYQSGDGCFYLALSNAEGDVLELELMSGKAPKPSAALPATGTYTAASTHKAGTLVASVSFWETDTEGVVERSANQTGTKRKFTILSGRVELSAAESADGSFLLTGSVTDGNIATLAFTWKGPLLFENQSGETDPIEYEVLTDVFGDYYANDYGVASNTYMIRGGNMNYEIRSQLRSSTPVDPNSPRPCDGEYTIDLRSADGAYTNAEFTFRSGYFSDSGSAYGTYWKTDDATYVATSGSFTVTTIGSNWKIQGTLRDDNARKEFSFTFTGSPGFR